MKADLKNPQQIEVMLEGGTKLSEILSQLEIYTQPGLKLLDIENKAQELIAQSGGKPGFAMVPGYHWATCININEGIVHGIPSDRVIKDRDVVTIDIGLFYKDFHTDMSTSFQVGTKDPKTQQFLQVGKKALETALEVIKSGNRVGHISQKIQQIIEVEGGYTCSRNLTGHGVGKDLHEYPPVPCLLLGDINQTPLLKEGMTLAIEVIYSEGTYRIVTQSDGWTIATADDKIAAVFEKTIAVKGDGCLVLTP